MDVIGVYAEFKMRVIMYPANFSSEMGYLPSIISSFTCSLYERRQTLPAETLHS
jgi:hypothetical protein